MRRSVPCQTRQFPSSSLACGEILWIPSSSAQEPGNLGEGIPRATTNYAQHVQNRYHSRATFNSLLHGHPKSNTPPARHLNETAFFTDIQNLIPHLTDIQMKQLRQTTKRDILYTNSHVYIFFFPFHLRLMYFLSVCRLKKVLAQKLCIVL